VELVVEQMPQVEPVVLEAVARVLKTPLAVETVALTVTVVIAAKLLEAVARVLLPISLFHPLVLAASELAQMLFPQQVGEFTAAVVAVLETSDVVVDLPTVLAAVVAVEATASPVVQDLLELFTFWNYRIGKSWK
jgi:hypothetical protein